jgi:DNA-binding NtrC family response regulator
MTGDKLVEKVKAKFPELPVIVITGYATKENIINIYKADKNCVVLTKPWELESLLNALSKLLKMALELPSGDME